MAYFLSTEHWLDAITPPLERHIEKLATTLQQFMTGDAESDVDSLSPPFTKPVAPAHRWKPIWIVSFITVTAIIIVTASLLLPGFCVYTPTFTEGDRNADVNNITGQTNLNTIPDPEPAFHLVGSLLTPEKHEMCSF